MDFCYNFFFLCDFLIDFFSIGSGGQRFVALIYKQNRKLYTHEPYITRSKLPYGLGSSGLPSPKTLGPPIAGNFFYVYYAGHGCSDGRQYIVLNEREVSKIFWPVEAKIKNVLARIGSNCKSIVVYDCCREDYVTLREKIIQTYKEIEAQKLKEA